MTVYGYFVLAITQKVGHPKIIIYVFVIQSTFIHIDVSLFRYSVVPGFFSYIEISLDTPSHSTESIFTILKPYTNTDLQRMSGVFFFVFFAHIKTNTQNKLHQCQINYVFIYKFAQNVEIQMKT